MFCYGRPWWEQLGAQPCPISLGLEGRRAGPPHIPCWLCCGSDSGNPKGLVLSHPVSSLSIINSKIITTQMHYLILTLEAITWLLPSEGTQRFVSTSLARLLGSSGCGAAEAKHPVNLSTKALRLKFVEITQRLKLNQRLNL